MHNSALYGKSFQKLGNFSSTKDLYFRKYFLCAVDSVAEIFMNVPRDLFNSNL